MLDRKIGIIGVGMVGSAMLQTFSEKGITVIAYDKFRPGFTDEEVHVDAFLDCDLIFISVPTLTKESGIQDLEPLREVLNKLKLIEYRGIVVSKCTTLPGTTKALANFFDLRIVHYPEFLTAANAYEDFKFQKSAILSCSNLDFALTVAEFLREIFPKLAIKLYTNYAATEIAKYTHNCFLATKLSFLNEIYDVCQIFNVPYDAMISGVVSMDKIGESHVKVPGSDGQRGWGGYCFPKDTKAFVHFMEDKSEMSTLKGAIETNDRIRK